MKAIPATAFRQPIHLLAMGLGSGAAPKAPGTFGTLAAIPFYLLWAQLPLWGYLSVVLLAALAGVYICGKTARDWGERLCGMSSLVSGSP
jgi:phosphatidylglycerophosphatase A